MSVPLLGAGLAVDVLPFTPASISGLQLWLDASDSSTLFQNSNGTTPATADGDPVGYWQDKSGNANHCVQSDGTKKPQLKTGIQNSRNVVRLDGSNDNLKSLTGGTDSNCTLFVVNKKLTAVVNNFMLFSMGQEQTGKRRCLWHYPSAPGYIAFNGYNADYSHLIPNLTIQQNVTNISQFKKNGNTISLSKNDNSYNSFTIGSIVAHTASSIFVGTNNAETEAYNGDYCEILYYTSLVSDSDRTLILDYLNTKWSIY